MRGGSAGSAERFGATTNSITDSMTPGTETMGIALLALLSADGAASD